MKLESNREVLSRHVDKTRDYKLFQLVGPNRKVIDRHVEALMVSMQKNPDLFRSRPILVNEKFEVMDGQHRLKAAMNLGIPVYYTVNIGMGMDQTRELNATQNIWRNHDYAHSFAIEGKRPYQRYLQLREETGLGHNAICYLMVGRGKSANLARVFRSGKLTEANEKQTNELVSLLVDVTEIVPTLAKRNDFVAAYRKMALTDGYNHQHFLTNLRKYGDRYLGKFHSQEDYKRAFENVYNMHVRDENRLRVF